MEYILTYIQNNIYTILCIIGIIIICLFFLLRKTDKKSNNIDSIDETANQKRIRAKSEAIKILQSFSISYINKIIDGQPKAIALSVNYPDNVSDYDVIMSFSRLSDENTSFTSDWSYPDGRAGENESTYIDGIIWGLVFAPEFIYQTVSHKDFIKLWKDERERKLELENIVRQVYMKDIVDNVTKRENEYILPVDPGNKQILYLDLDVAFQIFKETYKEYIAKKIGIKVDDPLDFFDVFAMRYGYSHANEMIQYNLGNQFTIGNTIKTFIRKLN